MDRGKIKPCQEKVVVSTRFWATNSFRSSRANSLLKIFFSAKMCTHPIQFTQKRDIFQDTHDMKSEIEMHGAGVDQSVHISKRI